MSLWRGEQLRAYVEEDGWVAFDVLFRRTIKVDDFIGCAEESLVREAEEFGVCVSNFRVDRELICNGDDEPTELEDILQRFNGRVFSMTNSEQYANGVSPNGETFVPVWGSAEDALQWQEQWPGFTLKEIGEPWKIREVLDLIHAEEIVCGIAGPDSLYTFDPVQLTSIVLGPRRTRRSAG